MRLITPIAAEKTASDADARLQKFMVRLLPVLDEYLPGSRVVARGND